MSADMRPYQGADLNFMDSFQSPLDTRGDILCVNKSGVDIPPYAPMKLNGSFTGDARQVIRPDEDSLDASLILFNGAHTVANNEEFVAVSEYEVLAKINGTPSVGDDIGTKEDQWYLDTTTTGFKSRGVITGGLAYASPFSGAGSNEFQVDIPSNISVQVPSGTYSSGTYNYESSAIDLGRTVKLSNQGGGDTIGISIFTRLAPSTTYMITGHMRPQGKILGRCRFFVVAVNSSTLQEYEFPELGRNVANSVNSNTGQYTWAEYKSKAISAITQDSPASFSYDQIKLKIEFYVTGINDVVITGSTPGNPQMIVLRESFVTLLGATA